MTHKIYVDDTQREIIKHGDIDFPITMYHHSMWEFSPPYVIWHWHNECEIGLLLNGKMQLECVSSRPVISAPSCYYINRNYLHSMKPVVGAECEFISVIFNPVIISGTPYNAIHNKYVMPIINRENLEPMFFEGNTQNAKELIDKILRLYEEWKNPRFGSELKIRGILSEIWLQLAQLVKLNTPDTASQFQYIKPILTYIQENYSLPLTLADIAAHVGISERTLTRCFKNCLGISVIDYLTEYRVRIAAQKLSESACPATDICFDCGFNDLSYFGKIFKRITGLTPMEYRKKTRQF